MLHLKPVESESWGWYSDILIFPKLTGMILNIARVENTIPIRVQKKKNTPMIVKK